MDRNLIKKEIKKELLDFGSMFIMKIFLVILDYLECFCSFLLTIKT